MTNTDEGKVIQYKLRKLDLDIMLQECRKVPTLQYIHPRWDFHSTWGINNVEPINDGTPFLRWEGYDSVKRKPKKGIVASVEGASP